MTTRKAKTTTTATTKAKQKQIPCGNDRKNGNSKGNSKSQNAGISPLRVRKKRERSGRDDGFIAASTGKPL
jgi:hypothetical protein